MEARADRLEIRFNDFKAALSEPEARAEASRCINCYDAPCVTACPTGIDIPKFIRRIGAGHDKGAAKTILDSNVFGLSCAQSCPVEVLCEGACVYHELDGKPISIGKLQRYAVEYAYDKEVQFYSAGKQSGKKVVLIGAGPASLACAHELRKLGHETVVLEKTGLPGGLNTSGIAPYKMKANVSLREIEYITSLGVKIEYGKELCTTSDFKKLLIEYDAIFLGMGLGPDSVFQAPGADQPCIRGAVEFISLIKTKSESEMSWLADVKTALVVGGGNTALDSCRELKGLGVSRVVMSYRRGEADMSGYAHELKAARQEGVEFWPFTLPVSFNANGKNASGRVMVTIQKTGSNKELLELPVDLVLVAIGQNKLEALLTGIEGLTFKKGRLKTCENGSTGNSKIFAGGDLTNGGKEVVNAVAEGKRAALAIHKRLANG